MQRHRHQQIGIVGHQARHVPRNRFGIGKVPPIFQPQRYRLWDRIIGNGCTHAGMDWRRIKACRATGVGAAIDAERDVAGRAPGRREQPQLAPARGTEMVVRARHRATAGAARRQGGVDNQLERRGKRRHQAHTPLSRRARIATSPPVSAPEIFDRPLRRHRRDRAVADYAAHDFLRGFMLEGLHDRLSMVTRRFDDVLDLGACAGGLIVAPDSRYARLDAGFGFARAVGGIQGDEDRLPFADASFDLVVSAGVLDTVNDLPGALALIRRVLRPDGLFLAAFAAAGSLATLRACLREAEGDRPAPRIHPQIDVRAAGDLLMRAGFTLPVADTEILNVRYRDVFGLVRDLRGMAASNLLPGRVPLRRDTLAQLAAAFAARADAEGRTTESFEIVFLTGWAPAESQPRPARRGSATMSLADALKPQT